MTQLGKNCKFSDLTKYLVFPKLSSFILCPHTILFVELNLYLELIFGLQSLLDSFFLLLVSSWAIEELAGTALKVRNTTQLQVENTTELNIRIGILHNFKNTTPLG